MAESDRLHKLRQQHNALQQKIRQEETRIRQQQRKKDTRRKILAGAIVLAQADRDENFRAALMPLLAAYLEDRDKPLFEDLLAGTEKTGRDAARPGSEQTDSSASADGNGVC